MRAATEIWSRTPLFAAAKHIIQLVEDAEPFVDGSEQSARNCVSGIGIDDVVGGSELLRPIRTPPVRGVKPISLAQAQAFQSVDRSGRPSGRSLTGRVVLAMIKPRAAAAGLPASTCCHTFRATSIMAYLSNEGTLEHAQQIAGHASPGATKLYDRTADTVTLDEIERIVI